MLSGRLGTFLKKKEYKGGEKISKRVMDEIFNREKKEDVVALPKIDGYKHLWCLTMTEKKWVF